MIFIFSLIVGKKFFFATYTLMLTNTHISTECVPGIVLDVFQYINSFNPQDNLEIGPIIISISHMKTL